MSVVRNTWLGLIMTLSALSVAKPAAAVRQVTAVGNDVANAAIEARLTRISDNLRLRERELDAASVAGSDTHPSGLEIAGWADGRRRSFADTRRGGFLNREGWRDGGGFYNRRPSGCFWNNPTSLPPVGHCR